MAKTERIFGIQSLLSKIHIADQLLPALVDSGAAISVLCVDVFEKLRVKNQRLKMEPATIQASAVNQTTLSFMGTCQIPCRWLKDSPIFWFTFYIASRMSVPCLLGFDLLHSQNCAVDFNLGFLDVGFAVLECVSPLTEWFQQQQETVNQVTLCKAGKTVEIPARSESHVNCRLDFDRELFRKSGSRASSASIVGLVEPCVGFTRDNSVLVASSLVKEVDGHVLLRVLNPTNFPFTLYQSQVLATFTPYSNRDLQVSSLNAKVSSKYSKVENSLTQGLTWLSVDQCNEVKSLLQRFESIFSQDKWDLGSCDLHKLRIQLKEDARPSRVPYRAMNPTKRKDLKSKVEKLKENDLIEPTHSEWAAPTVLVPKRDGSYRLVIDYRKLNAQTVKTSWPLPRISDILSNLEGSCYFSSLDLCSGFHQMEIDEEDRHLTSFITPFGLYQWKRMPMGLCNAPGAFQRLMEIVLSGLTYETVLVYLDDIIVFGRTFHEHLNRLEKVFYRIREANLKISPSKCALFQTKLTFLGHVVSPNGIQTDPSKVEAVKNYPVPKTIKQLRAFMGLVGFYRKFVHNFGLIAEPLYRLMNKNEKFQWTSACQSAFERLQKALLAAPILGFPTESDMFTLCTDASLTGIGAVLSQEQNRCEKVIAYASKTLQKGQRNYSATKRELFAVVFFTGYFREFLLGRKFKIITDHRALVWLYSFKDPDAIVARWLEKLSNFDFEIIHRPGKTITNADALSRIPENTSVMTASLQLQDNNDKFVIIQNKDKILSEVKSWCLRNEKPIRSSMFGRSSILQCYWQQFESLTVTNHILYRVYETTDGSEKSHQCCVPLTHVPDILTQMHECPSSGHLGINKTLARVRQRFYWPGIKNDICSWVSSCLVCQIRKNPKQKHRIEMQQWLYHEPFLCVSVDILGPLTESRIGMNFYKYILMIGDQFTRWFEAVPLSDIRAETVCSAFLDHWVSKYGVPEYIHSDNGAQFTSKLFDSMCQRLQMTGSRSTPYHPQGNAKVERINRTLEDGLSKYCAEHHETWCLHLQTFMMAYRSAVHESTGQSPFRLLTGREMRMPIDLMYPTNLSNSPLSYQEHVFDRLAQSFTIFDKVIERNQWELRRQKAIFDRSRYGPTYKEGDLVLLHTPVCKKEQSPKLKSFWSGPHRIVRLVNQVNFVLEHCQTKHKQIAHYDRIKPFKLPEQRLRRAKTKNKLTKTQNPSSEKDSTENDLIYVELTDNDTKPVAPLTKPGSTQPKPVASSAQGPSGNPAQTHASRDSSDRPTRTASAHARHPGFFRLFFESDQEDQED